MLLQLAHNRTLIHTRLLGTRVCRVCKTARLTGQTRVSIEAINTHHSRCTLLEHQMCYSNPSKHAQSSYVRWAKPWHVSPLTQGNTQGKADAGQVTGQGRELCHHLCRPWRKTPVQLLAIAPILLSMLSCILAAVVAARRCMFCDSFLH